MPNFYRDNDDLRFYMQKGIDWDEFVRLVELEFKAVDAPKDTAEAVGTYEEVLDLVGQFVGDEVAPRAEAIDREGTRLEDGKVHHAKAFDEIFAQLKEMGIYGMTMPRELGGMNLPNLLYFLSCEMVARGEVSTMTHFGFHAGIAIALLQYSLKEGTTEVDENGHIKSTRFQKEIEELITGEAWGSMDLTEPGAGSDLAKIRARAVKGDDGRWRITGNKIFITSGHGKYHLVLAKTESRDSLGALSLFLVPLTVEQDGETKVNAYVDRLEEKIGHHGSATASIQFEDSLGELVGKEGEGFKNMLLLMNNARLGVGFESIGAAETAYRAAVEYAEERETMGKPIGRHEMIADYLDEMDVTIRALRALAVEGAVAEEKATRMEYLKRLKARGDGASDSESRREIQKLRLRARQITPVLKYAAAEGAVWAARMSMQIHGGNGYTKDYLPERILRDALVMPVYEGTSQIQALMALKDHLLAAMKKPQNFLRDLATAKVKAVRVRDDLERRYWNVASMQYSAMQHILVKIAKNKWTEALQGPLPRFLDNFMKSWDPKRDFAFGLLHAEHLTRILADVMSAEILVEQAKNHPERREIAERWLDRIEPRVRYNLDLILHTGDRLLEKLQEGGEESKEVLEKTPSNVAA